MKTESADEFASRKKTITDDANSALVKTAATMKHFYDRKHGEAPVYEPGRLVWLEAVNIQLTRPTKNSMTAVSDPSPFSHQELVHGLIRTWQHLFGLISGLREISPGPHKQSKATRFLKSGLHSFHYCTFHT